jgi:hypothetical protein
MHDKTLMFFLNKALAKAANTEITSKLIDFRYNGDDIDGRLFVRAQLGAPQTDGYVRFKVLTSADGSTWVDAITATNVGAKLYEGRLPLGLKRYLKAEVKVLTQISDATTVFAEITDSIDAELDTTRVQKWQGIPSGGTVPEGMEDLAKTGDSVRATVEGS